MKAADISSSVTDKQYQENEEFYPQRRRVEQFGLAGVGFALEAPELDAVASGGRPISAFRSSCLEIGSQLQSQSGALETVRELKNKQSIKRGIQEEYNRYPILAS